MRNSELIIGLNVKLIHIVKGDAQQLLKLDKYAHAQFYARKKRAFINQNVGARSLNVENMYASVKSLTKSNSLIQLVYIYYRIKWNSKEYLCWFVIIICG